MDNRLRLICLIFALSLLVFPLTGWAEFGSGRTLVIRIDAPKNGSTVNTPTITVSGLLGGSDRDVAKVSINDVDAPVSNGKYSANITLAQGKNVINVIAISGPAKIKEQVTVTYAPAKK